MGEKNQADEGEERGYQNCGPGRKMKIRSLFSKSAVHKVALFLECSFRFP